MKQKIFIITLFVIPILLVLIFELALRISGFGENYALYYQEGEFCRINQAFPKKYFSLRDIGIPQMIEQRFLKSKQKNTIRIVCLGESTTAGFPYEVNINFPYFLQKMLQRNYPNHHFEVVNLGISAINSHAIVDMLGKVEKIEPDLILIYLGHNEFYGASGLASTDFIASNRYLIKLILWLREVRLFQLMQSGVYQLDSMFSATDSNLSRTLMEAMIGKNQVERSSTIYFNTISNYRANLSEILTFFKNRQIPVVISDLVCNLKDQKPLGKDAFSNHEQLLKTIESAKLSGDANAWQTAASSIDSLISHYGAAASLHYYQGFCKYSLGRYDQAKEHYELALDYDPLPFRAPSEINTVIRQLATQTGTAFVSAESLFASHSPFKIAGNNLFLEHLHPNAAGYELLARAFFQRVGPIKKTPVSSPNESYRFAYTDLDLAIGQIKIQQLLSRPPFSGQTIFYPLVFPVEEIDRVAREHVFNGLYWDAAHLKLGEFYLINHQKEKAIAEYLAILEVDSAHVSALSKLGDAEFLNQNWTAAINLYKNAINLKKNDPNLLAKLGKALIIAGENVEGIDVLSNLLTEQKTARLFNDNQLKEIYYLIGLGYAQQELFANSQHFLHEALKIDSQYAAALELEMQIKNYLKK